MSSILTQTDPYPIDLEQPADMVELEMAATRRRRYLDEIQHPDSIPITVKEQKMRGFSPLEEINDVNEDIYDILENIVDQLLESSL